MRMPPGLRSPRCTLRAAGFMATRESSWSPGVYTRWLPNWSWKLDTPNRVPAGARISAGKLGSVEMSLPAQAASVVNCSPVTCMPSPESPAKRMTARVSVRRGLATEGAGITVSLMIPVVLSVASVLGAERPRSDSLETPSRREPLRLHATQKPLDWQGYLRSDEAPWAACPTARGDP